MLARACNETVGEGGTRQARYHDLVNLPYLIAECLWWLTTCSHTTFANISMRKHLPWSSKEWMYTDKTHSAAWLMFPVWTKVKQHWACQIGCSPGKSTLYRVGLILHSVTTYHEPYLICPTHLVHWTLCIKKIIVKGFLKPGQPVIALDAPTVSTGQVYSVELASNTSIFSCLHVEMVMWNI